MMKLEKDELSFSFACPWIYGSMCSPDAKNPGERSTFDTLKLVKVLWVFLHLQYQDTTASPFKCRKFYFL